MFKSTASEPAAELSDTDAIPRPAIPAQITFRHVPASPAVVERVSAEVQKLGHYFEHILHCHIVITAPQPPHAARQFLIHLEIAVPGRVFAVRQEPVGTAARPAGKHAGRAGAHRDIYVVIRTVFDAARRQLQDHARRHPDEAKRPHRDSETAATKNLILDQRQPTKKS